MSPLGPLLFVLIGLAAFGWDWAADKAQAAFIFEAVLCATALVIVSRHRDRLGRQCAVLKVIALTGAAIEAMAVICALAYDHLSSPDCGVCDEATGRPVRAAAGVAVLLVAAYVQWRAGHGRTG